MDQKCLFMFVWEEQETLGNSLNESWDQPSCREIDGVEEIKR